MTRIALDLVRARKRARPSYHRGVGTADDFLARHPELLVEDLSSPAMRRLVARLTAPIAWLCRLQVRGFDTIAPGKCLLVANHSAALVVDIPLLIRAWVQAHGDRPARGLAHRLNWQAPMKWLKLLQRVGAVYAHPEVARSVLERGDALITFPGGESEALRPFSRRSSCRAAPGSSGWRAPQARRSSRSLPAGLTRRSSSCRAQPPRRAGWASSARSA